MKLLFKIYDKISFQLESLLKNKKFFWPSLVIASFVASIFLFIQFTNPLPAQLGNATTKIAFIAKSGPYVESELLESLELFDSSPLFVPTRWNYATNIIPVQKISKMSSFPEFEPNIDLDSQLRLDTIKASISDTNEHQLLSANELDLRILGLSNSKRLFSSDEDQSILKVESLNRAMNLIENEGLFTYRLNVSREIDRANPVILLVENHELKKVGVQLYQTSSIAALDSAVLSWVKTPSNLAQLPKGLLKLTFYP